jgi:hypothetical protein
MLIVIGWEPFETLLLLIFKGQYGVFLEKPAPETEPIADSQIGDIVNGVIGIALSLTFQLTFRVPSWCPSLFSPYRRIWMKRVALVLLQQTFFWAANFDIDMEHSPPLKAGALFLMLGEVLVYVLALRWNWTPEEISLFWSANPFDRDIKKKYELIYVAWFSIALLLLGQALYFVTYAYFQLWYTCLIIWIGLLVILAWYNRFEEFWYYLDFGPQKKDHYNLQPIGSKVSSSSHSSSMKSRCKKNNVFAIQLR